MPTLPRHKLFLARFRCLLNLPELRIGLQPRKQRIRLQRAFAYYGYHVV